MSTRAFSLAIAVVLAATACAPLAADEDDDPVLAGDLLYVASGDGVGAIHSSTGAQTLEVGNAVASSDWGVLFTSETAGGRTTVQRVDSRSGETLSAVRLRGRLDATVASATDGLVALSTPRSPGATAWVPDGRARTRIAIVDPTGETGPLTFDLDGNFEPEAFATDNSELYMIEYIPAMNPNRYQVRRLKLNSGRVVPIGRLKSLAPTQMQGTGRIQVPAPNGDELYTLYTQQGPNYAHGEPADHRSGDSHAFIHVLNLRYGWAHCIDLPVPFGTGSATANALAVSAAGDLYAADWSNGAVAVVRPEKLKVITIAGAEFGSPDDDTFATVAGDLLYVAGNSHIVVLDANTLEEVRRIDMGKEVAGLGSSADGGRVYVSLGDEIVTLDASGGRELTRVSAASVGSIHHVASD